MCHFKYQSSRYKCCCIVLCCSEGDGMLCMELFRAGQQDEPDICVNDELVKLGLLQSSPIDTSNNISISLSQVVRPG